MTECAFIEEQIVDYLDDSLDATDAGRVRAHIERCAVCREMERSYRSLQEAYRAAPESDVAEALADELRVAARTPLRPSRVRVLVLAAAAVLALLLPLYLLSGPAAGTAGSFEELVRAAQALDAAGEHAAARVALEEALGSSANETQLARVLEELALLQVRRRDYRAALQRLDQLAAGAPGHARDASVLILRVIALEELGETERADALLLRLAAEMPDIRDEVDRRWKELERELVDPTTGEFGSLQGLGYIGD